MPVREHVFDLPDEEATRHLGAALAHALLTHVSAIAADGLVVGLSGDLGAGKTSLTRATLRAGAAPGRAVFSRRMANQVRRS